MNPIVNPWMFYFINVTNSILGFSLFFCILSGVILIVLSFMIYYCYDYENSCGGIVSKENVKDRGLAEIKRKIIKWIKIISTIFVVTLFLSIFTPSKDTLYKMIIASYITEDNVMKTLSLGKDFKNEIKKDILDIINNSNFDNYKIESKDTIHSK